jgi:hypothetical protein
MQLTHTVSFQGLWLLSGVGDLGWPQEITLIVSQWE